MLQAVFTGEFDPVQQSSEKTSLRPWPAEQVEDSRPGGELPGERP